MSKEENIATLNEHLTHWKRLLSEKICDQSEGEKTIDALQNAIKALEQDPCEDCISREAVIKTITEWLFSKEFHYTNATEYLRKRLDELPSVTPMQKWIPVSERLPEFLEDVLLCDNGGDVQVGYYRQGQYANGQKYFEWFVYNNNDYGFEPFAWIPLPKPYKAESEG